MSELKLVPIDSPKPAPAAPKAEPQPALGEKPQAPEVETQSVDFFKGDGSSSLLDDMRQISGEDPDRTDWKPLTPDDTDETEEQPAEKPEETKTEETEQPSEKPAETPESAPSADGKIKVGKKEFTPEQLATSYEELNRALHKKTHDHEQEVTRHQLKISELLKDNQLKAKILESKMMQAMGVGDETAGAKEVEDGMGEEDFERMIEEGKGSEAVKKSARAEFKKMLKAQEVVNAEKELKHTESEKEKGMDKQIETNLSEMQQFKSFEDNRVMFADYLDKMFGKTAQGQQAIKELAVDLPRLKSVYADFLKSNYDWGKEIEKAKGQGQAIAVNKESLKPINVKRQPEEPKKQSLAPVDRDLSKMEAGLHGRSHQGFFKPF